MAISSEIQGDRLIIDREETFSPGQAGLAVLGQGFGTITCELVLQDQRDGSFARHFTTKGMHASLDLSYACLTADLKTATSGQIGHSATRRKRDAAEHGSLVMICFQTSGENSPTTRRRNCTGHEAFLTPISERPWNEAGPTHALTATPCHREDGLRASKEGKQRIMKILMVLTSHDQLGNTGKKTGFWLEELAAPYYVFKDAGAEIVLASPKGGQPPLDPKSNEPDSRTDATNRFEADAEAQASTEKLSVINPHDFDGIFYPGGHGPLWDLAEDPASISLIETFIGADKPVALVCHAPGVLRHVKGQDGKPLVQGKEVTGFTNTEEEAVGLTRIVPFLVEDELAAKGGRFTRADDWASYVVQDGLLITGQNPGSSEETAQRLLSALKNSQNS